MGVDRALTLREKDKRMQLEIAVWNSKKNKVLLVTTFNSTKELLDFMADLQKVEKDASYTLLSVKRA